MARKYQTIRTAAWTPVSSESSLTAHYRALPFPEQWREALLDLCNAGRSPQAEPYRTVPTWRLDQVLQALAPDVIVRPRPSFHKNEAPDFWLYTPAEVADPLPGPALRALLSAWLRDLRPEREHRDQRREVEAMLSADPPQWQPVEAELLRCPPTKGGTAAPEARQFQLTTDHLARRILALEPYDSGAGKLHFRAVPRGPRDQGAELVSQPLPWDGKGDRTWWFSVVLNVTLHTVPFQPLPRLHVHTHIRRWATRTSPTTGRLRLPFGRRTSVLLRPRVPWLPGAPASERFAVARLEWNRAAKGIDWVGGGPAGMLADMSLTEPFPDADAVLGAPEDWLADMRAGVVYSTAMGSHEVGAGLMSNQRSQIVRWAEQALPEQLRPAPALEYSRRASTSRPVNVPAKPSKEVEKAAEEVRVAAARRTGAAFALDALDAFAAPDGVNGAPDRQPRLEARLLWQTAEMRDTAIAALVDHLGLKDDGTRLTAEDYESAAPGSPAVLEWDSSELTVRLHCLKLTGPLAGDLSLGEGRPTRAAVTAALSARRGEARAFLGADRTDAVPSLALVEIDRREDFTTPDHDPKFALRLGCADVGVLTQFMAVPKKVKGYNSEKNADFRARKAWDDGLRQLGARVHPEHNLGEQLPDDLQFAAVWMVRKNARSRTRWAGHEPVAVRVVPTHPGAGLARVEGWDRKADNGAGRWIPYPALLLRLTALSEVPAAVPAPRGGEEQPTERPSWWQDMKRQRQETEEWLQKVVRSLRGTPTLLLAHAQNCRSHWTWLQDGQTEQDRIRTGLSVRRLDPDLRLVRVRTARGRETAQWWGVHRDPVNGVNGLPADLWTDPTVAEGTARVFWSTTPKALQFRQSAVEADKLAPRPLQAGPRKGELTVDTDKAAWNPGLVELAVLGCHQADGDDPEALAMAVHQLRQAPDHADALSLPLPLHLAGLAQEYVLPTLADENTTTDPTADTDPDAAEAAGLAQAPEPDSDPEQLSLFATDAVLS
ncbi:pPIWI_RE module domain-containing protein [Kitasatospora sp. NPDC056531]|uniref:pPIWI_RE module domain-containing protein n=1 Tax=Kitasatospora sp. NPDC056531 TaxID=3345856 RepID=UPI0036A38363